jgi:rhamnosyltransferase
VKDIAAGIVLYNPDNIQRFHDSLKSVLCQFSKVYLFDNSTEKIEYLPFEDNVVYLTKHKNLGIAYALNRMMEQAERDGFQWLVTMDQDSILPDKMVEAYRTHIYDPDVAIICPQVIDKRRAYMTVKTEPVEEFVEECITSGSCTSIETWKKLGKFDEWLFVDLVDNEFCKRVIVSGYKILQLNSLVMNQEFGKIIPKPEKTQQFWLKVAKLLHNENFAKFSYKKFVSPARVYYTNRNIIYVNKKLADYGPVAFQNYNCKGYPGFWISFNLPSFLRAQDKKAVWNAIWKGRREGLNKHVERWVAQKK